MMCTQQKPHTDMSYMASEGLNWVVSIVDVGSFAGMITGLLAGIYGQSRIYFVTLAEFTYFLCVGMDFVPSSGNLIWEEIHFGGFWGFYNRQQQLVFGAHFGPNTCRRSPRWMCEQNSSKEHRPVVVLHKKFLKTWPFVDFLVVGTNGGTCFFLEECDDKLWILKHIVYDRRKSFLQHFPLILIDFDTRKMNYPYPTKRNGSSSNKLWFRENHTVFIKERLGFPCVRSTSPKRSPQKKSGLIDLIWFWFDLIGFDLIWLDLIWFDWIWFDLILIWFDFDFILILIWFDLIGFDLIWFWFWFDLILIWFDLIWLDLIWFDFDFDLIWFDLIGFDLILIWFDLIWLDLILIWFDWIWFDLILILIWFWFWFWFWFDFDFDLIWFDLIGFDLIGFDFDFDFDLIGFDLISILIWLDLIWFDFDFNLIWLDLIWFDFDFDLILILIWFDLILILILILIWFDLIGFDLIWLDLIWFDFDLICFDLIGFDFDFDWILILIWFDLIWFWFDLIWFWFDFDFDLIWFDLILIWFDLIWLMIISIIYHDDSWSLLLLFLLILMAMISLVFSHCFPIFCPTHPLREFQFRCLALLLLVKRWGHVSRWDGSLVASGGFFPKTHWEMRVLKKLQQPNERKMGNRLLMDILDSPNYALRSHVGRKNPLSHYPKPTRVDPWKSS